MSQKHFTPITLPPDIVMSWQDRRVGTGYMAAKDLAKCFNLDNWRGHPELQRLATEESLDTIGWIDAIKLNLTTDKLIDGHLRVTAAVEKNPDQQLPVDFYRLTEEQEAFALAYYDALSAEAVIIPGKFDDLMKRVRRMTAGKEGLEGIDAKQMERVRDMLAQNRDDDEPPEIPAQVDKAQELQEKWQVQPGDLFQIGPHRLLCGDCREKGDVERVTGGEKWAIMFTDPPYGISYDATSTGRSKRNFGAIQGDDLKEAGLLQLYKDFLSASITFALDNSSLYVCGAVRTAHVQVMAAKSLDIRFAVPLVWVKQSFALNWDRYHPQHEWIFYGGEGSKPTGKKSRWFGPKNETTVWQIDRENTAGYLHPTTKPVELAVRAIRNSTETDEWVFDPFLGSGTTMLACEQLKRRCLGMEIEPKYCAVILQRLQDAGLTPELIGKE